MNEAEEYRREEGREDWRGEAESECPACGKGQMRYVGRCNENTDADGNRGQVAEYYKCSVCDEEITLMTGQFGGRRF